MSRRSPSAPCTIVNEGPLARARVSRHTDGLMPRNRLNPEGPALWPLVWRDTRWPIVIMLLHIVLAFAVTWLGLMRIEQPQLWRITGYGHGLIGFCAPIPFLFIAEMLRHRSMRRFQRRYVTIRSFIGVLVVLLFVAQESQMHEAFKRFIGRPENPFRWDATFARVSSVLSGGVPAYHWMNLLFHDINLTVALDQAYLFWFPLMFYLGATVAWLPHRGVRQRALLCWGLVWIVLGTVLAHVFSSAGPVYYHHVVAGSDPYAPLLAHLDSVNARIPLVAVQLQGDIWNNLQRSRDLPWLHISAFPSIHVALPVFFGLVFFRVWRGLGLFLFGVTVIIVCGSIYLGWHYAIDGYASIGGVALLWWLSGRLLRLLRRMAWSRRRRRQPSASQLACD